MLQRTIAVLVIAAGCRAEEPSPPVAVFASAVVGVRCRDGTRELHLVLTSSNACSVHRARSSGEEHADAVDIVLPDVPPLEANEVPGLLCRSGLCDAIEVRLDLRTFYDRYGATGRWSASIDGIPIEGVFDAGWCGPAIEGGAESVSIEAVSINQGVEIPILDPEPQPVIAGRLGIVMIDLSSTASAARQVTAILQLNAEGDDPIVHRARTSVPGKSSGTISLGPIVLGLRTRWSISLTDADSCAAPGAPAEGTLEASPGIGPLRVVLVPIRYLADGSGSLPDTSEPVLSEIERRIIDRYPIESMELSVHEPFDWSTPLDEVLGDPWGVLVNAMIALRQADAAPPDVFYYGMVSPAQCSGCVAGVAADVVEENDTVMLAAVGQAYDAYLTSEIMLHELGHLLGRDHAPCGGPATVDRRYPYENGTIGIRGWSSLANEVLPPDYFDLMSYCSPSWISDYNYRAIYERIALVSGRRALTARARPPPPARVIRCPYP